MPARTSESGGRLPRCPYTLPMTPATQICSSARKAMRAVVFASAFMAPVALTTLSPVAALAQRTDRIAAGKVVSKDGAPVKGAVVHLKDTRSLSQRSYITGADGTFRFGELSGSTDYDIWADLNGAKSNTRSISSFDSKNNFDFTLKMK